MIIYKILLFFLIKFLSMKNAKNSENLSMKNAKIFKNLSMKNAKILDRYK